jgi:hypothetical protein
MSNTTSTAFRAPIKEQTTINVDLSQDKPAGVSLSDTKEIPSRVSTLEARLSSLEEDYTKLLSLVQSINSSVQDKK